MKSKISNVVQAHLLAVIFSGFVFSGCVGAHAQSVAGAVPPPSIPTFSTADISRQGFFFVGGHYVGAPGKETMDGPMYVEVWVPKIIRHPYPILFIAGAAGQSSIGLRQTPDGRPGWAYYFLKQGYTIYMVDYPTRGRSTYLPDVDGKLTMPRSGPLMEEIWTNGRAAANPAGDWPTARKATQWPGKGPNKGKMGDPVFDAFAKQQLPSVSGEIPEKLGSDAMVQLIDTIGHPVILLINSGVATAGWLAADARPKLVQGIVAVEPVAPPIENAERGATGPGRIWGLTNLPIRYEPPVNKPSDLQPVRQDHPDAPGLLPCWIQKEPAHKLINLQAIPVLDVSAEASYHRPYAHCVAKWLNQAGVKTTFVRLEDVGLTGNGHMMMAEKNSDGIAKYLEGWIEKNLH